MTAQLTKSLARLEKETKRARKAARKAADRAASSRGCPRPSSSGGKNKKGKKA